jgi:cholera toxin transcriptional activator
MNFAEDSAPLDPEKKIELKSYALRLGDGAEFAEFDALQWRLTVFHVLGVYRQVSLGYAEIYLLDYFTKNPGKIISRQELLDHAWGARVVTQGSLNQAISNLRGILGDDQSRKIIITVPRQGYQFRSDAVMEWKEWIKYKEEIICPAESDKKSNETQQPTKKIGYRKYWRMLALWGGLSILVLLFFVGIMTTYFYKISPPYAIENFTTPRSKIKLVTNNQESLDTTSNFLQPLFKRMDALGGGHALINLHRNYLEFNCLHSDGSIYTLLVQTKRVHAIEDEYIKDCLR